MPRRLRTGFPKESGKIASEIWDELQAHPKAGLDPFAIADRLEIPVEYFSDLRDSDGDAVAFFTRKFGDGTFSAFTIKNELAKRIVYLNDSLPITRQRSSLAHELAHALLMHRFAPPLREDRVHRNYDSDVEAEATRLGGELLIPRNSALYIAAAGWSDERVTATYGLSLEMVEYRMNFTKARKIIAARNNKRRKPA